MMCCCISSPFIRKLKGRTVAKGLGCALVSVMISGNGAAKDSQSSILNFGIEINGITLLEAEVP